MTTWNTYWSRRVSVLITATALSASAELVPTAHAATISFTDNNCASYSVSGTAPNFTLVCNTGGTTPPPPAATVPSGCLLGANPNTLPAGGGTVTLTATCSAGDAPSAFLCSGGTIA